MNNGLHEVISAAVQDAAREAGLQAPGRPKPLLRAIEPNHHLAQTAPDPADTAYSPVSRLRRRSPRPIPDADIKDDGMIEGMRPDAVNGAMQGARPLPVSGMQQAPRGGVTTKPAVAVGTRVGLSSINKPMTPNEAGAQLGPGGLRLAFWLCGFHDALMERRRNGEQLTEGEELLVTLSSADFVGMRPLVVDMTLGRLETVVNEPGLLEQANVTGAGAPEAMEVFALTTLRNLSQRAGQLLQDEGPEAALALFGESRCVVEPLAIFQLVFTAALDLVEAFERMIPVEARLLVRLAEELDSEVERI